MKPMVWHPEEKDAKVNEYLEQVNHAPYGIIVLIGVAVFCLFTFFALMGSF